jgi:DNA replicative helicase MCM subunit Mcm2 (Cdc46/Mcm family)
MIMEVDLSSQISVFGEFFTSIYKSKIDQLLLVYPTQKSLMVSYPDLEKFDPDIADALVLEPDLIIEAAEPVGARGQDIQPSRAVRGCPCR